MQAMPKVRPKLSFFENVHWRQHSEGSFDPVGPGFESVRSFVRAYSSYFNGLILDPIPEVFLEAARVLECRRGRVGIPVPFGRRECNRHGLEISARGVGGAASCSCDDNQNPTF